MTLAARGNSAYTPPFSGERNLPVILRTDRLSPVALHLASRPRSYVRLQAGNVGLEGTSTLLYRVRLQEHYPRAQAGGRRGGVIVEPL